MNKSKRKVFSTAAAMLIALTIVFTPVAALPGEAYAFSPSEEFGIGVFPELISDSRQPASGGMFAWVAFDYDYQGTKGLHNDLDPSDFVLQRKTASSDWVNVRGNNIVVLGGSEYYLSYFESIVAARVPDNIHPFTIKWRLLYRPANLASEVIVQAANLSETDDISVTDYYGCSRYRVEKAAWSYDQYKNDKVPPIYVAYADPDAVVHIEDPEFVKKGDHKIILPWGASWGGTLDMDNGTAIDDEKFDMTETKLYLGDVSKEDQGSSDEGSVDDGEQADRTDGIAALVQDWSDSKEYGTWPGGDIPEAKDLYRRITDAVYVPDEDADEWLTRNIEGTYVFWISGAGTSENVSRGVTDYILVVVRDWTEKGVEEHDWNDEASWEWTGDDDNGYTAAKAKLTCRKYSHHSKMLEADVSCEAEGDKIIFTAKASYDGVDYVDEKVLPSAADRESLKKAIDEASADKSQTTVTDKTGALGNGTEYAPEAAAEDLDKTIDEAKKLYIKPIASQDEVDAMKDAVEAAKAVFDEAKLTVEVKKSKLEAAYRTAVANKEATPESKDGTGLKKGDIYANKEAHDALAKCIEDAEKVIADDKACQNDVDDAAKALNEAINDFDASKMTAAKDPEKPSVRKGASAAAADKAITASTSEQGPSGTVFRSLRLRSTKKANTAVTLSWAKPSGAATYVVYGNLSGKANKMKKIATVSKTALTVRKAGGKKLAKGKYYKFIVVALDKNKKVVSTSKVIHVATTGGKAGNVARVTTAAKKNAVTIKKGKTFKLAAKQTADKKKSLKTFRKLAYETSNSKVATVSAKGVITGKAKGTCYVYSYAQDGTFVRVKVTVK